MPMKPLIDADNPIWVPIEGYEGLYWVSYLGKIKSRRGVKKLRISADGYVRVNLYKEGSYKPYYVHRLVGKAFLDNPDNLPEIHHKDEDKWNNHAYNLEWCTSSQNSKYSSYKTTGSKCGTSKLNEESVLKIKELILNGQTQTEIAKLFDVTNHAIHRIQHGYNWSWLTGFGKEAQR